MVYNDFDYIEIDYFDDHDYEEERLRETAMLNRRYVLAFEKKYNCTFPQFIMMDHSEKERIDLILWASSIRYLTLNNENLYEK
jgi:hypothetical protein